MDRGLIQRATQAAKDGNLEALKMLLKRDRALANATGSGGWAPLHLAARHGHYEVAELLLEHGASVRLRSDNRLESRPIHGAAAGGHARIVALLLDHGADANVQQRDGWTPLHLAAESGHGDAAALLLESGARVNAKTDDGLTPLDLALSKNHLELADLLRRHGGVV